jgi:uncharacterized membrane protein
MFSKSHFAFIVFASFICILIAFETVENCNYIKIAYDLSVGFIVSAIFYWIVVYLPESNRRR